jgi:hypothetical protein
MKVQYGYLEYFIVDLRSAGRYAFSFAGVRNKFEQSNDAIKKALQRLKTKGDFSTELLLPQKTALKRKFINGKRKLTTGV